MSPYYKLMNISIKKGIEQREKVKKPIAPAGPVVNEYNRRAQSAVIAN